MRFVASIYPGLGRGVRRARCCARFNLHAEQPIKGLSHGERVKATLLLVLARRPRLLLLDEPTTGLDPVARHEILAELMDVVRDERRAILFSSHNTQDVEQISDRDHLHRSRPDHRLERQGNVPRSLAPAASRRPGRRRAAAALPGVVDTTTSAGASRSSTTKAYTPDLDGVYERAGVAVRDGAAHDARGDLRRQRHEQPARSARNERARSSGS